MNHKNYYAYMMSKRKVIMIKEFEEIFDQLDYVYSIIEKEKEITFVDQSSKTLLKLKHKEGWVVTVSSMDEVFEKWRIIKSKVGYVTPLSFVDDKGKVLAYVQGCWLIH